MRPDWLIVLLAASAFGSLAPAAEAPLLTLSNNPFSRPAMLALKPPAVQRQEVRKQEPVELELNATMLSQNAPMVIADGKLLGLGDSIRGLRLVEVLEGRAVFSGANGMVTFSMREDSK